MIERKFDFVYLSFRSLDTMLIILQFTLLPRLQENNFSFDLEFGGILEKVTVSEQKVVPALGFIDSIKTWTLSIV